MGEREKGVTSRFEQVSCSSILSLFFSAISVENAKFFVIEALKSVGSSDDTARLCADVLIEADRRGHFSHGMNILRKHLILDKIITNS